jgi:hypothetical protein
MSGLIGLSGIEGLGQQPPVPPGGVHPSIECVEGGGQWDAPAGICVHPDPVPSGIPPDDVLCRSRGGWWDEETATCKERFEAKSWPELTAHPSATKIGKTLAYAAATIGGAYYYGWKGGVAGFFGTAAMSSLAGTMVYHRQPEPEYKLAMYLTAGLGAVAAAIAVPAWAKAERVR